ncbi:MAG: hypothetical protein JKX76_01970 [Colwellia sp.]|nr:hypothetical protein [Colwellia sp.]
MNIYKFYQNISCHLNYTLGYIMAEKRSTMFSSWEYNGLIPYQLFKNEDVDEMMRYGCRIGDINIVKACVTLGSERGFCFLEGEMMDNDERVMKNYPDEDKFGTLYHQGQKLNGTTIYAAVVPSCNDLTLAIKNYHTHIIEWSSTTPLIPDDCRDYPDKSCINSLLQDGRTDIVEWIINYTISIQQTAITKKFNSEWVPYFHDDHNCQIFFPKFYDKDFFTNIDSYKWVKTHYRTQLYDSSCFEFEVIDKNDYQCGQQPYILSSIPQRNDLHLPGQRSLLTCSTKVFFKDVNSSDQIDLSVLNWLKSFTKFIQSETNWVSR